MPCYPLLVLVAATALSQAAGEDRSLPGFVLWKPEVLQRSIARSDRELSDKPSMTSTSDSRSSKRKASPKRDRMSRE